MRVELYNTTNQIKRIPRYRYNGKYVFEPHQSYEIDSEQAYFFKPYARIGIVIRSIVNSKSSEDVVKLRVDSSKEINKSGISGVQEKVDIGVSDKKEDVPVKIEEEKSSEPTADSSSENKDVKYTEDSLEDRSIEELRNIASSLGIDASKIKRKDYIRKKIIKNQ